MRVSYLTLHARPKFHRDLYTTITECVRPRATEIAAERVAPSLTSEQQRVLELRRVACAPNHPRNRDHPERPRRKIAPSELNYWIAKRAGLTTDDVRRLLAEAAYYGCV